jgi:tyrosinase
MAVIRSNVLSPTGDAETFLRGAVILSQRQTSVTAAQLNASAIVQRAPGARVFGPAGELNRPLSWWDLFAWWHFAAMSWPAGVGNRAHRGSVFLPWHRLYLRRLEEAIQIVTGDDEFALPYWDWAQDGTGAASPLGSRLWTLVGTPRGTVTTGTVGQLRVRLLNDSRDGRLYIGPPRNVWRDAGRGVATLPTKQDEAAAVLDGLYDGIPWNERADSFRNKVEGFQDPLEPVTARRGPWMHNRVHVWIGGEMAPGTSPNDPVFWLNHCNVDRIWEGWMTVRGRTYLPPAGQGPVGQRANDPLFSIVWPSMRASEVLDPSADGLDWYEYDAMPA